LKISRAQADLDVEAAFVRHRRGELESAQRQYREVLAQFPDHAAALHYLGLVAQQTGHALEAVQLLQRSIASDPADPRAHNHLGQIWITLGEPQRALGCFEDAVQADPGHADSLNSLATALRASDPQRAQELYRRALACDPPSANAAYNLAALLQERNESDAALELLQQAIRLEPRHFRAHQNLAVLLEQKGLFEQARAHYLEVRAINPRHALALSNLLAMRDYEPDPQAASDAESLVRTAGLPDNERSKLHSSLGKYYDRRGRYDEAFLHFTAAKQWVRRRAPFDLQKLRDQVDRTMATFTADWFDRARSYGHPSTQPVFIVGMPRSGTTLTEQILASHPAVFAAGELQAIPIVIRAFGAGYPECVTGLGRERLLEAADQYLAQLTAAGVPAAACVTDKLPVNFSHLGLIATLFPHARVVWCRRDPLDVALSCYIELFVMENDYTAELPSFGEYFLEHERLMAHWRRVLPMPLLEQRYEDLVGDVDTHARALVAHCGLEWDPVCLEFQRADRAVRTPSRWQVRQPVYRSSVGRWRHYAKQLEPLRKMLAERGHTY
jgi:Flp pilus assembly protein TadD